MDTKSIVDRLTKTALLKTDETAVWDAMLRRYPSFSIGRLLQFGAHRFKDAGDVRMAALYKSDPVCFATLIKALDSDSLPSEEMDKSIDESSSTNIQVKSEPEALNEVATPVMVNEVIAKVHPNDEVPEVVAEAMDIRPVKIPEPEKDQQGFAEILEEIQNMPTEKIIPGEDDILEMIQELPNSDPFELTGFVQTPTPAESHENALALVENTIMDDEDKSLMVMLSFTDWLKHFKHKSETEQEEEKSRKALKASWQKEKLAEAADEELDEIPEPIFKQAMESITMESNLISESLAEILARQGKIEKAVAMYKKLSLRNPEKSTYFAVRIQELNTKHD